MLRFGKTEEAKKEFYHAKKKIIIKVCDVNVDNIVTSKVVDMKNNFKYFIGY